MATRWVLTRVHAVQVVSLHTKTGILKKPFNKLFCQCGLLKSFVFLKLAELDFKSILHIC